MNFPGLMGCHEALAWCKLYIVLCKSKTGKSAASAPAPLEQSSVMGTWVYTLTGDKTGLFVQKGSGLALILACAWCMQSAWCLCTSGHLRPTLTAVWVCVTCISLPCEARGIAGSKPQVSDTEESLFLQCSPIPAENI